MLVEDARLVDGVLARCVRVERTAQGLELQGDLLGASPRGALEHHVLEEVRHAETFRRLMHGGRAHPGPKRHRPHSRHVLREYGQPIWKYRTAELRDCW